MLRLPAAPPMRSRAAWARGRLHRMLVRLRENPFSSDEVLRMKRELDALEAHVEALGEVASRERADVDALEAPWWRGLLWLVGQLEERELKERREYEVALAAVLREGERAAALRARLDALGPHPAYDDAYVAKVLKGVGPRDFRRFGTRLGGELLELREGLMLADDLWWLERQTERTYQIVRAGRRRSSMVSRLSRLERGLRNLDLHRAALDVGNLKVLYESDDDGLVNHRQQRARRVLLDVKAALTAARDERLRGLSDRLAELVRDAQLPAWP